MQLYVHLCSNFKRLFYLTTFYSSTGVFSGCGKMCASLGVKPATLSKDSSISMLLDALITIVGLLNTHSFFSSSN